MAKTNPRKQIKEGAKILKEIMRDQLKPISDDMVKRTMAKARGATAAQLPNVVKDIEPKGVNDYKKILTELFGALAADAINQARKEVPKAKNVKLSEWEKLPAELKRKLKLNIDLLADNQMESLKKALSFSYLHNYDTTDSMDLLNQDLIDGMDEYLDGPSISAGAEISSSTIISTARDTFFDDPEVGGNIEAFQFINGDPVTPICTDLDGTVFAKDDPDRFRYTPPLHWNCKSYIAPILVGNLGNREIEKLKPSSKKIEETIQFDEALKAAIDNVSFMKLDPDQTLKKKKKKN